MWLNIRCLDPEPQKYTKQSDPQLVHTDVQRPHRGFSISHEWSFLQTTLRTVRIQKVKHHPGWTAEINASLVKLVKSIAREKTVEMPLFIIQGFPSQREASDWLTAKMTHQPEVCPSFSPLHLHAAALIPPPKNQISQAYLIKIY